MKTVGMLLEEAARRLSESNISQSLLNAQVLLAHLLNCKKLDLTLKSDELVDTKLESIFVENVKKRCSQMPVNYITGSKEFMGLNFRVSETVLIPRDETEILVEETVKLAYENKIGEPFIFDIGSGCGSVSISLAALLIDANVFGIDVSEPAVTLAQNNAILNNVAKRAFFARQDIFKLSTNCNSLFPIPCIFPFDIIVSNPPYIPTNDISSLQAEIQFEPREALDGGADGLKFYNYIAQVSKKFLKDGGYIALETGYNQAEEVKKIFEKSSYRLIKIAKDYMGYNRVVIFRN